MGPSFSQVVTRPSAEKIAVQWDLVTFPHGYTLLSVPRQHCINPHNTEITHAYIAMPALYPSARIYTQALMLGQQELLVLEAFSSSLGMAGNPLSVCQLSTALAHDSCAMPKYFKISFSSPSLTHCLPLRVTRTKTYVTPESRKETARHHLLPVLSTEEQLACLPLLRRVTNDVISPAQRPSQPEVF